MKSSEFMLGTNRFVIKLDDNSKVIVVREIINNKINYIVNVTSNIDYALSDFAKECGYVMMLHGLNIEDDIVTVEATVVENILLKEEYHIINGNEFGKFIEFYVPYPEEITMFSPITLCFEQIKEITGDTNMIQDMIDENILAVSQKDLIKHEIITKPKLTIINNGKNNCSSNQNDISHTSLLKVINGKSKIKKK